MECAELRVSFHRDEHDDRRYDVELHRTVPGAADEDFSGPFRVEFDWDAADEVAIAGATADGSDPYGKWLTEAFFRDPGLREKFAAALALAAGHDGLRVRLCLTPGTRRLHNVFWERLLDPEGKQPLSTREGVRVSRFLAGGEARSMSLRPRSGLRALVAIANPAGLDNQTVNGRDLAPVAADEEWERAQSSLNGVGVFRLVGRATLENLAAKLRDDFDILYLVCHGALIDGEPWLWLEDETGGIDRAPGARLAARLKEMRSPPRLVVLASCRSSGMGETARSEDRGDLSALAPRLAEAGVPAVIAMQSDVRMTTAARFFPTFFTELLVDGQIDRAMAVARAAIAQREDWWVPVLITRLRFGRIWSEFGGGNRDAGLDRLVINVAHNLCTPILGPGLATDWTGSPRMIARLWAERFEFPMAPTESDNLPEVAQYLSYHRGRPFLLDQLEDFLRDYLARNFPDRLLPGAQDRGKTRIVDVITYAWLKSFEALRERAGAAQEEAKDAYWQLAGMPFTVYITTNRDDLLAEALRQRGKNPVVEVCRWPVFDDDLATGWPRSIFQEKPHFRPDVDNPLVFHAFGHMRWPATLVLTEDNFFDYLIGITRHEQFVRTSETGETGRAAIPGVVRQALAWRSLLFLGFRISDWEFRTLFRRLLAQEKSVFTTQSDQLRQQYPHIAVQLDPASGGEYMEPEGAREYLKQYFGGPRNVGIYWGPAQSFIEDLHSSWKAAGANLPTAEDLDR
jgi:hypothetical protein